MTEMARPSERVRRKWRMTDEEDGDDVEDRRWTRRRTEQEREEKEWHAQVEQVLVQMDTQEKRRVELDEQQVVLGRRLVAGVDWVGELLEGMVELLRRREGEGSDRSQRGGEEEDEEVRGTEGDGNKAENGKEGDDEEMKGDEGDGENREEEDGGKEGHGGDGEDRDAEGQGETDVVME